MVANVNLDFSGAYTPPSSNAVNLEFNPTPPPADVTATFTAQVSAPVLSMVAEGRATATIAIAVAKPVLGMSASYDQQTSTVLSRSVGQFWQLANPSSRVLDADYQYAVLSRVAKVAPYQDGVLVCDASQADYQQSDQIRVSPALVWQVASSLERDSFGAFGDLTRLPIAKTERWQTGDHLGNRTLGAFVQLLFRPVIDQLPFDVATRLNAGAITALHDVADSLDRVTILPWGVADQPKYGRTPPTEPPRPRPPEYVPSTNLDFVCEGGALVQINRADLNFSGGISCPVVKRRTYVIMNEVYLKRVSDDAPIQITSVNVGIDKDSFCWSFSATVAYTDLDLIEPSVDGPVEVELGINGFRWRWIVESYSERKQFAKTDISVTGRSLTALLTEPYAAKRTYNHTGASFAAALAAAELNRDGISSGFDLDWQLIDDLGWPVPANTLNYDNLTPIQAIQKIAEAGGGFVSAHPEEPTVIVYPDYAAPVWQWGAVTPNKSIPFDLVLSKSMQWQEKPAYNGVYVAGVVSGVTAFARISGTAGDYQAPMYVDRMSCDVQAARQKAISILSEGGKQAMVTLDMPMHNSIGLITPPMMVEVTGDGTDWLGRVHSVSISVSLNNGVTVRQSVQVERHY